MDFSDYVIAIPSYKRADTLKKKTMNVLQKNNIPSMKIHIFVADNEQEDEYKNSLDKNSYNKMIVGEPGIKNIRNFMANYFDEGQRVFYIDDDISEIFQNYNLPHLANKKNNRDENNNVTRNIINRINGDYDRANNRLLPMKNLDKFITNGFKMADSLNIDNWGVYPVENPYFMKPTCKCMEDSVSTKLNYIMGGLTGIVNNRESELRTIDDKEDYERTLKYYLKDNGVLRFNNVSARTNCYKEPGGMQVDRTKKRICNSAKYLCEEYPELCTLNNKKKSGYTEIKLCDKREPEITHHPNEYAPLSITSYSNNNAENLDKVQEEEAIVEEVEEEPVVEEVEEEPVVEEVEEVEEEPVVEEVEEEQSNNNTKQVIIPLNSLNNASQRNKELNEYFENLNNENEEHIEAEINNNHESIYNRRIKSLTNKKGTNKTKKNNRNRNNSHNNNRNKVPMNNHVSRNENNKVEGLHNEPNNNNTDIGNGDNMGNTHNNNRNVLVNENVENQLVSLNNNNRNNNENNTNNNGNNQNNNGNNGKIKLVRIKRHSKKRKSPSKKKGSKKRGRKSPSKKKGRKSPSKKKGRKSPSKKRGRKSPSKKRENLNNNNLNLNTSMLEEVNLSK